MSCCLRNLTFSFKASLFEALSLALLVSQPSSQVLDLPSYQVFIQAVFLVSALASFQFLGVSSGVLQASRTSF